MRPTIRLLAAALLTASLGACAAMQPSMQIRAERNPAARFASYATYAWATPPLQAAQWPAADDRVAFDWQVRGLVDQQMAHLGYQQVPIGDADLLADYGVRTQEETMSDSFSDYSRYRAEGGTQSPGTAWVMGYERGTLTVDMTDPRLRTLIWYGEASAVVNPSLRAQRLPLAVAEIFASFPARTAP